MTHAGTGPNLHLANYAQDVLENMSEAFFLLDRDFRILDGNSAAVAMDGRSRDELLRRTIWELAPSLEESELGRILKQVMAERQPQSSTYHQKGQLVYTLPFAEAWNRAAAIVLEP